MAQLTDKIRSHIAAKESAEAKNKDLHEAKLVQEHQLPHWGKGK